MPATAHLAKTERLVFWGGGPKKLAVSFGNLV
jgi:hypothetical protein